MKVYISTFNIQQNGEKNMKFHLILSKLYFKYCSLFFFYLQKKTGKMRKEETSQMNKVIMQFIFVALALINEAESTMHLVFIREWNTFKKKKTEHRKDKIILYLFLLLSLSISLSHKFSIYSFLCKLLTKGIQFHSQFLCCSFYGETISSQ